VYLIEVLLPLYDNNGQRVPRRLHGQVRRELTEKFGGLTAHTRAPAEGLWKDAEQRTSRDDIVIYEVMCEGLDRAWWTRYRLRLEKRFRQQQVIVRAHPVELL
jgi:hypothetical protein